jgi:hypothetical protein
VQGLILEQYRGKAVSHLNLTRSHTCMKPETQGNLSSLAIWIWTQLALFLPIIVALWVLLRILKRLKWEQIRLMAETRALPFQKVSITSSNSKWLLRTTQWMQLFSPIKQSIQLTSRVDSGASLSPSSPGSRILTPRAVHRWAAGMKRREALRKASALGNSHAVSVEAAARVCRVRGLWTINSRKMRVQGRIHWKP